MRGIGAVVFAAVSLTLAVPAAVDVGARAAVASDRTCFQPYPMSFERSIQYAYEGSFAVFSGEARLSLKLGTASIKVIDVWKGKLGTEVTLPNGTRDIGDGTLLTRGEGFDFTDGEKYLIFARGNSADSLVTGVCLPSDLLAKAKPTIAVLNRLAKRSAEAPAWH
jgi:hypothetical protein